MKASDCNVEIILTHLSLDKMAAILADGNFKCSFLNENDSQIPMSLRFVPRSLIDNKPTCDKPSPELVLTQSTDAFIWH